VSSQWSLIPQFHVSHEFVVMLKEVLVLAAGMTVVFLDALPR